MARTEFGYSSHIEICGTRVHNLKNITTKIPRNQLTVVTGVSGSGKSSLVFDTIYAEGQRRYLEAFGSYARQFMGEMERPDMDALYGISPVVAINQKTTNRNPRSTVGTTTEIYDFFRLLYARIAKAYSMRTGKLMVQYTTEQLIDQLYQQFQGQHIAVLAPLVRGRKGHYKELFLEIIKKGYIRVRTDGVMSEIEPGMRLDRYKTHDIEAVIDQLVVDRKNGERLERSITTAMNWADGLVYIIPVKTDQLYQYSKRLMCADTGISYEEPSPLSFSFNSPYGYCTSCRGLGILTTPNLKAILPNRKLSISKGGIAPLGEERDAYFFSQVKKLSVKCGINIAAPIASLADEQLDFLLYGRTSNSCNLYAKKYDYEGVIPLITRWHDTTSSQRVSSWVSGYFHKTTCETCQGTRLREESLFFKLLDQNIADLSALTLSDLFTWVIHVEKKLSAYDKKIAQDVLQEIKKRLQFLLDVGLYYLAMDRPMASLSGGESQRIRLATQIGSQLQGVTYVLDEPSIGLHPRDNQRLIHSLHQLRDMGNTVIVVEHDKDIMLQSDYLIDIGPGAGKAGGTVVAEGTPKQFCKLKTTTAQYLTNKRQILIPTNRRKGSGDFIRIKKAAGHNLKKINVGFPLGTFTCVTGVSGSGKSTLVEGTLYPLLHNHCYNTSRKVMPYQSIDGLQYIDKVIEVSQSPIGRTPRSCPATYSGFYTEIRQLFASVLEAKLRGYNPGRFSFNVKGGRCEACEGVGVKTVQMNFLPDVYLLCDVCNGKRFNRDTLEIRYKHKSICDVLSMSVNEAVDFFKPIAYLYKKIKVLQDVGLGYITLGQSAVTLSGGEAQRVKLSSELVKKETGKTVYILDEPTTGLHFQDIQLLVDVLQKLVDKKNTVIVIEHNLDIVKVADHILDLGKEGGAEGGQLITFGTPEKISAHTQSYTGAYLKYELTIRS